MSDFPGRVVLVILVFIQMVMIPLTIITFTDDLTDKRMLMNEVTNLIDKVTDTGKLTDLQRSDFYLGVSSHGVVCDTEILRYVKVVSPDGHGGTVVSYVVADDTSTWNQGDIVKVSIEAIDYTGAQKLSQMFLHLFVRKVDFSLAGSVRE